MTRSVEIDSGSGFCGGVIRAIGKAEEFLGLSGVLYSLGAIVHNEAELARLGGKGLQTVGKDDLDSLPAGSTLLIRAHGEPPDTYALARKLGLKVIDCTCPVVLRLQRSIREAWERVRDEGGQVILFGKPGHAEVLGLLGQTGGNALVVENMEMLEEYIGRGLISPGVPLEVFSQTTKSPDGYRAICARLTEFSSSEVTVHETICSQVASRHRQLAAFAAAHDVIIFVSGSSSSNGKVLFELCRSVNPRSYHIGDPSGIDPSWVPEGCSVGVCGATSTPKWLLEEVAERLRSI